MKSCVIVEPSSVDERLFTSMRQ